MNRFVLWIAVAGLSTTSAFATNIFFDFTAATSTSAGFGTGTTGFGATRTYVQSGITMTVTSWSVGTLASDPFQNALLRYDNTYGLEVCSVLDTITSGDCGIPTHSIDNEGNYEFVLFHFSTPIFLGQISIDPFGFTDPLGSGFPATVGRNDRDVSYFLRNSASALNLTGSTLAGLSSLGFGARIDRDSTQSDSQLDIGFSGAQVTDMLFGARVGGDANVDYFKVERLDISTTPEPGSFLLMGSALLALGWKCRRTCQRPV